ncbi:MAG: hypothetical protein HQL53_01025 [Magnetococcales bacterium]|nr:hypothetical protein [Magnetococcales bacterium]
MSEPTPHSPQEPTFQEWRGFAARHTPTRLPHAGQLAAHGEMNAYLQELHRGMARDLRLAMNPKRTVFKLRDGVPRQSRMDSVPPGSLMQKLFVGLSYAVENYQRFFDMTPLETLTHRIQQSHLLGNTRQVAYGDVLEELHRFQNLIDHRLPGEQPTSPSSMVHETIAH